MIWVNYLISDEICQKNANAAKCGKNVKCGHFCSNAHGNAKLMNNFVWCARACGAKRTLTKDKYDDIHTPCLNRYK